MRPLFGPGASVIGNTVSRLKQVWGQEYRNWCGGDLSKEFWVYIWADGIYSGLRSEQTKPCALVIIGVNQRGEKRFLAIEDGVRESTQSWREVLLKLKSLGMNPPELGIRDAPMGLYDFPAHHWQSLRTSDPIESTFGTIRRVTKRSKGCLSREGMLHMLNSINIMVWGIRTEKSKEISGSDW